jgi:hypothetical protein
MITAYGFGQFFKSIKLLCSAYGSLAYRKVEADYPRRYGNCSQRLRIARRTCSSARTITRFSARSGSRDVDLASLPGVEGAEWLAIRRYMRLSLLLLWLQ